MMKLALGFLAVLSLAGCLGDAEDASPLTTSTDTSEITTANTGYFALRLAGPRDPQGGAFTAYRLSRVTTRCADGSKTTNLCPVARLDYSKVTLARGVDSVLEAAPGDDAFLNPNFIVRGSLELDGADPVLRVREVWRGVRAKTDVRGGEFYLVEPGKRAACEATPCDPIVRSRLNYAVKANFDGLVFDPAFSASEEQDVRDAIATPNRALVYGLDPHPGKSRELGVVQAFLRVDAVAVPTP